MGEEYTFGDNDRASVRLRKLAELYAPDTHDLLEKHRAAAHLAVDLGCGPGWCTDLLNRVLSPSRSVGLDSSDRYIAKARERFPNVEFQVHNIADPGFPVDRPDFLFCRFLLTHFADPAGVLRTWASIAAPGARLVVHETEGLEAEHPALRRYYELVDELQGHYGQDLYLGARLDECFEQTPWKVIESVRREMEKPAALMAELHLDNLITLRSDPYAQQTFDHREMDWLEESLGRISSGTEDGGVVLNAARQIAADLPG
ncbi:MAG TPA: class I SAM-dependent methyltransferase [Blastocatellia bacterium]